MDKEDFSIAQGNIFRCCLQPFTGHESNLVTQPSF